MPEIIINGYDFNTNTLFVSSSYTTDVSNVYDRLFIALNAEHFIDYYAQVYTISPGFNLISFLEQHTDVFVENIVPSNGDQIQIMYGTYDGSSITNTPATSIFTISDSSAAITSINITNVDTINKTLTLTSNGSGYIQI